MVQYMRNKPIKWGVKLWVLVGTTGYTADFIVYTGKDESTEQGLTFTVVTDLLEPFHFQGYEVHTDNLIIQAQAYFKHFWTLKYEPREHYVQIMLEFQAVL